MLKLNITLQYGVAVYGGTSGQNIIKITVFQKQALRTMLQFITDATVRKGVAELKLISLREYFMCYENLSYIKINF